MKHQRINNAVGFGRPKVLLAPASARDNATNKWRADWDVHCSCSNNVFRLFDMVGDPDSLDALHWVQCVGCQKRFPLFGGALGLDVPDDEGFDEELIEKIACSKCGDSESWKLYLTFQYNDDLQEEAEEDFPEYFEEGLANQWNYFELIGKCKCGHTPRLFEWEAW